MQCAMCIHNPESWSLWKTNQSINQCMQHVYNNPARCYLRFIYSILFLFDVDIMYFIGLELRKGFVILVVLIMAAHHWFGFKQFCKKLTYSIRSFSSQQMAYGERTNSGLSTENAFSRREGWRQKQRQRSSRLFGGQTLFNSLPR